VSPRLTDHDGYSWHVHYLAVDCGMALAHRRRRNEVS
jgi:hypothetical protein